MAGTQSKTNSTPSKFHLYSYGIVASNKALNSQEVEVTPVEDLPMTDGQVTEQTSQFTGSGTDSRGNPYQTTVTQSSTVTAQWLPIGEPNRQTAPDVRRGEQVMLYRMADADKFYWCTMRADLSLRKLETVIYGFGASAKEGDAVDDATTYVLGFSAHQKRVWLSTSKANGELFAYTLNLDLANGIASLSDDIENSWSIDSQNHIVRIQNADKSFLELNKTMLNSMTTDGMNFKTNAFVVQSQTYKVEAEVSVNVDTANATLTATAGNQVNANTELAGDLTTVVGSGGSGNVKATGNFSTSGTLSADAGLTTLGTVKGATADFETYENLPG